MRFNLKEYFDYYKLPAVCYSIEIYKTPLSISEFENMIVERLKYYGRRDGVSWLAVYSTTDSKNAKQAVERTGKRGRPRKVVKGKKVEGHAHVLIIGNKEKSAYSTAQTVKNSIDKKYQYYNKKMSKVVSKGDNAHAYNFMEYSMKQADTVRTGGEFDFANYLKEHEYFS